jgi:dipeptidase
MLFLFIILLGYYLTLNSACTTTIVGKKASIDGSVMCSHSADGGGNLDARMVYVPARDYSEGSKRPIFDSPEVYPRYVGAQRGIPAYFSENCEAGKTHCDDFPVMGYIPQVNHTYAYFETTYGIMNEKQVGIGESTCSGVFVARNLFSGGSALLSIDELSRIALERSSSSREAVQMMGDLAVEYGFYGASGSFEGSAENLMVIDKNEGFVFHILPDETGSSAIWIAQRVPDDSVTVVANMFVVREVDLSDTFNFLGRQDMWDIAEKNGLWKSSEPKDWTKTFSDGEYAHKYYTGRRVWGGYRIMAPTASSILRPEYKNLKEDAPYPFSLALNKEDKLLDPNDIFRVHRDYYADTEFSTAEPNLAGGAFGSPWRFSGGKGESQVEGNWERTIVLSRTSSSFVVQARNWLPDEIGGVTYFGAHCPTATVYTPLMHVLKEVPGVLADAWQGRYSDASSFWAHRLVANVAQLKWAAGMEEDLLVEQHRLEHTGIDLANNVQADSNSEAVALSLQEHANTIVKDFKELLYTLLFRYADGYKNYWNETTDTFISQSQGYPAWWLSTPGVGYRTGPPPVSVASEVSQGKNNNNAPSSCLGGQRACIERCTEIDAKSCALKCHDNC